MHSIRTKITLLTVCFVFTAMTIATLMGVVAIRNIGMNSARQMLQLLCQSGEKNLDSYFESVEQSVDMVSAYVESDLDLMDVKVLTDEALTKHMDRVQEIFTRLTYKTNGVKTYYYRIDPEVSAVERGFWYVNTDGEGFRRHAVTDITQYDTSDTEQLVWFTVPKATGRSIWLSPYITDNLDVRVISYNVPVYWKTQFIGVIGIEIDYSTVAGQVDNITLLDNGYAFLTDGLGRLIYHPRMDVSQMPERPSTPEGVLTNEAVFRYSYDGVEKQAAWMSLSNGMRLIVAVPMAEVNEIWHRWVAEIAVVSVALLAVFLFVTFRFTGQIVKPLTRLTEVAEQINEGNYDCELECSGSDEVAILTKAINQLNSHLKTYISDLNDLAYADPLTAVHNKGAFDLCIQKLQNRISNPEDRVEFAVGIFDCNDLKSVNDLWGHDKGDLYLRSTCDLICRTFDHSPVFRIGGDEFAVVMQGEDYDNRVFLQERFDKECARRRETERERWDRLDVARGIAVYEGESNAYDVVRHADKLMYEHKWQSKRRRGR